MLLQDTRKYNLWFWQVSLLCYLWTYISIHISTYYSMQLILTKFCIHGGVIWRWDVLFLLQSTFNNIPKTALKLKTDRDTLTVIIKQKFEIRLFVSKYMQWHADWSYTDKVTKNDETRPAFTLFFSNKIICKSTYTMCDTQPCRIRISISPEATRVK